MDIISIISAVYTWLEQTNLILSPGSLALITEQTLIFHLSISAGIIRRRKSGSCANKRQNCAKVHDTADHSEAEFDGPGQTFYREQKVFRKDQFWNFPCWQFTIIIFALLSQKAVFIFMQTTLFSISDSVRLDVKNFEFSFSTCQLNSTQATERDHFNTSRSIHTRSQRHRVTVSISRYLMSHLHLNSMLKISSIDWNIDCSYYTLILPG